MGKLGNALKLGVVTALLVSAIPFLLTYFISMIPFLGPALAQGFVILSVALWLATLVISFIAYYVMTWLFKGNRGAALKYGVLLAIGEYLVSFDPVQAILAGLAGIVSFEIAKLV